MSWNYWGDYERRPRRKADGIKAQSQRGKFGQTWWAGRWIAALERLGDAGRLSRGRSYARSGQVLKLDVDNNGVKAEVQGSRPKPYRVSIAFRKLSDAEWERVIDAMAGQAIYAAKLLSGEMPEQIEEVFAEVGTSLLPAERADLVTNCSCPDWSNPCKHIAAVHYLLGERFDTDPFLMFELRGRNKDSIITALRERRGVGPGVDSLPAEEAPPQEEVAEPLPAEPAAFWGAPAATPALTFSFEPPPVNALAVKRLGAPPFWTGDSDFSTTMEELYRAIGDYARRVAMGEE